MNFERVLSCSLLVVFLVFQQFTSAASFFADDNGDCGFSDPEEDLCASYCYKSVRGPLAYIIELKETIKALEQKTEDRGCEIIELEAKNQQIERLWQSNKDLQNYIDNLTTILITVQKEKEEVKLKADEDQKDLKNQIERMKKNEENYKNHLEYRFEMEKNLKKEIQKLKGNLNNINGNHQGIKSKDKQLMDYQAREKSCKTDINKLHSNFISSEKELKEYEIQLLERIWLRLNQITNNSLRWIKRFPTNGYKGFSTGNHTIINDAVDSFEAHCNDDIECDGWLVIHSRLDGMEDFHRNWNEYRDGFGNITGDFFIGLEKLHRITNSRTYELYVDIAFVDGRYGYASYDNFTIGNENTKYQLESLGEFRGTVHNAMSVHLPKQFSTIDQGLTNCAESYGAWWHDDDCGAVQLNQRKLNDTAWHMGHLKSVQMIIRPKHKV